MCLPPSSGNCVEGQTLIAHQRCLRLLSDHKLLSIAQKPLEDWPWYPATFGI